MYVIIVLSLANVVLEVQTFTGGCDWEYGLYYFTDKARDNYERLESPTETMVIFKRTN